MMKRNILYIALGTLLLTACDSSPNDTLVISQNANGSSGEYWEYECSCEGVLTEISYEETRNPLNLGPGYSQQWTFAAEAAGEVTIYWTAYESGTDISEDKCYSVTYIVDEDMHITEK